MRQHQKAAKSENKFVSDPTHLFQENFFTDFEDFTENLRGWNNEFRQLDKGKFRGELLQVLSDSVLITYGSSNRRLEMQGLSTKNMKTFGIPFKTDMPIVWQRKRLENYSIQSYGEYNEFKAVTPEGFTTHTVAISEALIGQICKEQDLPELEKKLNNPVSFTINPHYYQKLQRKIYTIIQSVSKNPICLNNAGMRTEIENEIPKLLLKTLASSHLRTRRPLSGKGEFAIKKVSDYIAEFEKEIHDPITVSDLCKIIGVSERTLQYAFREQFGISPKTYLQARRLNAVRKELRIADPSSLNVNEVVHRWGFWHMGQFAADYKNLFGELPSETLQKQRIKNS